VKKGEGEKGKKPHSLECQTCRFSGFLERNAIKAGYEYMISYT